MSDDPHHDPPSLDELLGRAEQFAFRQGQEYAAASHFAIWQTRQPGQRHPASLRQTSRLYALWHRGYHGPMTAAQTVAAFKAAWCAGLLPDVGDFVMMSDCDDDPALHDELGRWLASEAPTPDYDAEALAELERDPLVQRLAALEQSWWAGKED